VEKLVIGIPARNEAATIAQLADTLEMGAALFGEGIRSELVLAYQPGEDETLERWHSRQFQLPHRVLRAPEGVSGKGRNVKQLILYTREAGAHLLLVDADLKFYRPSDVAQFVGTDRLSRGGMTLPLWCRPRGQGNSTDFFACPLLYAMFGARIRHPLAGQMILTNKMLETIEVDALPDDYGIDVALTIQGLNEGLAIDQVVVPFPGHEAGGNSGRIMENVANAMLAFLAPGVESRRTDVNWPHEWWEGQTILAPSARSLRGLIDQLVSDQLVSSDQHGQLTAMLSASPAEVRDFWCDHLAGAALSAQAGQPIELLVSNLVGPFLVHAEYRRLVELDFAGAEAYVADLAATLADALS
jgi:hypothetical protein